MKGYRFTANWRESEIRAKKEKHGWVIRPKPEKRHTFTMAALMLERMYAHHQSSPQQ